MTRFLVFLIIAYIVYYLVKNSFKDNKSRKNTQNRREKKSDLVSVHVKEIAYIIYSATKDGNTCDACLALDGKYLLPGHKILTTIKPPHAGCKNPKGCRCTLIYVTRDEEGGREIESFLKKRGGMCDVQVIENELFKSN